MLFEAVRILVFAREKQSPTQNNFQFYPILRVTIAEWNLKHKLYTGWPKSLKNFLKSWSQKRKNLLKITVLVKKKKKNPTGLTYKNWE